MATGLGRSTSAAGNLWSIASCSAAMQSASLPCGVTTLKPQNLQRVNEAVGRSGVGDSDSSGWESSRVLIMGDHDRCTPCAGYTIRGSPYVAERKVATAVGLICGAGKAGGIFRLRKSGAAGSCEPSERPLTPNPE